MKASVELFFECFYCNVSTGSFGFSSVKRSLHSSADGASVPSTGASTRATSIVYCRVLLGFTGFYWVLLDFTGFYWVLLGFIGFYWVLLGFTEFYWILPSLT